MKIVEVLEYLLTQQSSCFHYLTKRRRVIHAFSLKRIRNCTGEKKKLIFDQYINEVESNEYRQRREKINEENDFKITDLLLNYKNERQK